MDAELGDDGAGAASQLFAAGVADCRCSFTHICAFPCQSKLSIYSKPLNAELGDNGAGAASQLFAAGEGSPWWHSRWF